MASPTDPAAHGRRARLRAVACAILLAAGIASGCGRATRPETPWVEDTSSALAWPIEGPVSSTFGPRGKTHHDGIDIAVPRGTAVHAAAGGVVIFTGQLRGYGNTVILEHPSGLTTVYAHLAAIGPATGARVRRGETIGTVGETGRTTGPNLHFEVRRNRIARDPLAFLPERKGAVVAQRDKAPPKRTGSGG
ncbi:M23 family metallopeptidase [bacterium]|nr:M23 family metallopeptidase [bacterium]